MEISCCQAACYLDLPSLTDSGHSTASLVASDVSELLAGHPSFATIAVNTTDLVLAAFASSAVGSFAMLGRRMDSTEEISDSAYLMIGKI